MVKLINWPIDWWRKVLRCRRSRDVYNGGINVPCTEGLNAWLTERLTGRLMTGDECTNEGLNVSKPAAIRWVLKRFMLWITVALDKKPAQKKTNSMRICCHWIRASTRVRTTDWQCKSNRDRLNDPSSTSTTYWDGTKPATQHHDLLFA